MADLRALVRSVHSSPGVRAAVAAGRDGLLIDAAGVEPAQAEHLAALAPGLTAAAAQLAEAAAHGAVQALVVEGAEGVLVALPLSGDVTVVAVVGGASDDAQAVGDAVAALRAARTGLAASA